MVKLERINFKNFKLPALSEEILNALQDNIEKAINEAMEYKLMTVNLGNTDTVSLPEDAEEIQIVFQYVNDNANFATIIVPKNSGNGYYNMAAYYWQATDHNYQVCANVNWDTKTIMNCSSDAYIKKIYYK